MNDKKKGAKAMPDEELVLRRKKPGNSSQSRL
jgi:hypothetical protein